MNKHKEITILCDAVPIYIFQDLYHVDALGNYIIAVVKNTDKIVLARW